MSDPERSDYDPENSETENENDDTGNKKATKGKKRKAMPRALLYLLPPRIAASSTSEEWLASETCFIISAV